MKETYLSQISETWKHKLTVIVPHPIKYSRYDLAVTTFIVHVMSQSMLAYGQLNLPNIY